MKYCKQKLIGVTVLCFYIIFLIIYLSMKDKNMEHFESESEPRETFYHALVRNKEIDILEVIRSIQYEGRQVSGFIGQNIIYKIYSKLKGKNYIIMRYPDFRNEIKRHSKAYFDKYFHFIENQFVELNKNYIFDFTGFHGIIDNKVRIWIQLMQRYDRSTANEIMGTTYLIPNDKQLFMNNYVNGRKYILKNSFGGARSALQITNNREDILHHFDTNTQNPQNCEDAVCHSKVKYNIVQNYIEPTFLMKGLKFGLRMFLVIVCKGSSYDGYIYKDGYCYYSEDKYNKDSTEMSSNVVGAIAKTEATRDKYNLPESYKDFEKYILQNDEDGQKKLDHFQDKMREYCKKITESNKGDLCRLGNIKNSMSYMIYAMDIEIDKDFKPFIFEANVYFTRFDMRKRLGGMVSNMYNDVYFKLGLSNEEVNGMWELS